MKVLGIETSCDETAAAVVTDEKNILSNVILSQIDAHSPYGGVVPEIASRTHIQHLNDIILQALTDANVHLSELDGIAATAGPGLIGGLIVGLTTAKGLSAASNTPLIAVNHLEGHALTARLTNEVTFPYLLLLISGGHCQILIVENIGKYRQLGTTLDDALGEAFDKTAKMLGLGYPGGPEVEKRAQMGNPDAFDLPRPMIGRNDCNFSFSGLKTALYRLVESQEQLTDQFTNDLCASFQHVCGIIIEDRMLHAISHYKNAQSTGRQMVIAGGVAANQALRTRLETIGYEQGLEVIIPPPKLCTDNAAMIAWAGIERLRLGDCDFLDASPKARWPLDATS